MFWLANKPVWLYWKPKYLRHTMDELNETFYFTLNVILSLILATFIFGLEALIVFGLIMAPVGLLFLVSIYIEGAFGISLVGKIYSAINSLFKGFLPKAT
jgi:hypothetical protein